jgi:drug/metabolite transporter (DMT)-like permease
MMKKISNERKGEVSVLAGCVIWSLFPVLTILSYTGFEPITSLAWTTLFSLVFFLIIAIIRNSWINIFKKEIFFLILGVAIINGILYYVLFFIGLKHTSAGNASIIATMEILFSYLFFNVWRKEYIHIQSIIGVILMLGSALIVLSPNFSSFRVGDFFILLAVFIVPIGNLFQKKLRTYINSEQILFYRTLIATPFLFMIAYLFKEQITMVGWDNTTIILLINGVIMFGFSKILWLEGIFRISITKAISMSNISPIFTLLFSYLILKDNPTIIQLIAIPLALIGIYFLTKKIKPRDPDLE